jgi:benzoyl-CoA reductase subunit A
MRPVNLYLGVDLGSTTSKAVLIDEQEQVVGRGITNTRSSYDVAVEVARREAIADAMLARVLPAAGEHAATLAAGFRLERDLHRLGRLRAVCRDVAAAVPGEGARLAPMVDAIVSRVCDEAETELAGEARARGSFFRDVVGARFFALLDEAAARDAVDFDRVAGVYDRAILQVENEVDEVPFDETVERAVRRARLPHALAVLEAAWEAHRAPPSIVGFVGTGYGRARLPFPRDNIRSEILCHGLGAHALYPRTRTVLDIGGQDTKAIQIDAQGLVTGFQMNDRCAAGCGRYLGYIADELNLGLHELGPLALGASRPCRITSTCTVFAGIELRDLLSVGEPRENILAGLHRAIVTRALSLLARSGGVHDELTFTGGVAKNPAAVAALRELVGRHYGARTINVDPDSIFTGALGAALFARRGVPAQDLEEPAECVACTD